MSVPRLHAWERARVTREDGHWLALSAVAFALAMAARETAWTLPFAVLLVELCRGERWRDTLWHLRWHGAVLGAAVIAILASPTYRRLLSTSFALRGPMENLAVQVDAVAYLVTHPLLTLRLNVDPDLAVTAPGDGTWLVKALLILATLAVAIAIRRTRPWLALSILWFYLHLAPTNGPIARLDFANDRQLYLALIGPALALGVVIAGWRRRSSAIAATSALVLLLVTAMAMRNLDYRSEIAL
jgi:hypothetical protein